MSMELSLLLLVEEQLGSLTVREQLKEIHRMVQKMYKKSARLCMTPVEMLSIS